VGVYRYLILSLIAYLLAHWGHVAQGGEGLPRCGEAAQTILKKVLPQAVIEGLLAEIGKRSELLLCHGIEVSIGRCKL
jgi:hypothetical protein